MISRLIKFLGLDSEKPNNTASSFNASQETDVMIYDDESNAEHRIIKQIHNEFDTAPQRLLEQAIQILEKENSAKISLESEITEKARRLEKLGFLKNENVVKKQEIDKINNEKTHIINLSNKEAENIKYYSEAYPFLKFLTESELDRICDKYGLIYAPVAHYKNNVPDKNLMEIENAQQLMSKDANNKLITWEFRESSVLYGGNKNLYIELVKILGKNIFTEDEITDLYVKYAPDRVKYGKGENLFWDLSDAILGKRLLCDGTKHIEDRSGYFIAAPKEHFDLNGLTKNEQNKGFYKRTSVVYKDPIVFRYVKGGIQVISKWGLEGNDEALQVGILN